MKYLNLVLPVSYNTGTLYLSEQACHLFNYDVFLFFLLCSFLYITFRTLQTQRWMSGRASLELCRN